MSEENKATVQSYFEEMWNKGNLDVADEIFSADYINHDFINFDIQGPGGIKKLVSTYRDAYLNIRFTLDDIIAEGDRVVTRWTASGTPIGDVRGLASTGKRVTVTGMFIARIFDGKIEEGWSDWSILGIGQSDDKTNMASLEILEERLTSRLDTSDKIFYDAGERSTRTIAHVDVLTKFISVGTIAFTILGIAFAYLGIKGIKDISDIKEKADKSFSKIENVRSETEILREIKLSIGKIRDDLSLDKNIEEIDYKGLEKANRNLNTKGYEKKLGRYLLQSNEYQNDIKIEATVSYLDIIERAKIDLNGKIHGDIVSSHIKIIKDPAVNWETRLRVRENLIRLSNLEKTYEFSPLTDRLNQILVDKDIRNNNILKLEASRILATVSGYSSQSEPFIVNILIQNMNDKRKSFWRRASSSSLLIRMNKIEGLGFLLKSIEKENREGLQAAFYLVNLAEMNNEIIGKKVIEKVINKIQTATSSNNMNTYLSRYAKQSLEKIKKQDTNM